MRCGGDGAEWHAGTEPVISRANSIRHLTDTHANGPGGSSDLVNPARVSLPRPWRVAVLSWILSLAFIGNLPAQILLSDRADDAAYADGWQVGDNGGFGLGAWTWVTGTLGSATGNGADILPTIDTTGTSWRLDGGASAVRPITATVGVGATLSIQLDVGMNEFFGFTILAYTELDSVRLYSGDAGSYGVGTGSGGSNGSPLGVTSADPDGVIVRFTVLQESVGSTAGRVRVGVQPFDGAETTRDMNFFGSHFTSITVLNPGLSGEAPPLYFNSIEAALVPEPAQVGVTVAVGLMLGAMVCRGVRRGQ